MASAPLNKKKIVIIGCGASGSQCAAKAAKNKNYDVTVITPFEYMEISLCMTKAVAVGPEEHNKAIFPLLREDGVNYIIDTVVSLSEKSLTTSSGQSLDFDVAVIAVGQRIPAFFPDPSSERTIDQRKAAVAAFHQEIRRANTIVVSGGGAVGVETAADIKLRFMEKKVVVVHPDPGVLSAMPAAFGSKATAFLTRIGVELLLEMRVTGPLEGGQVQLSDGRKLACDLLIVAHAVGGNAGFLPPASRDARCYALVDDTFAVRGLQGVFALGDCSTYDPVKTYPRVDDQLPVLLRNMDLLLQGRALQRHVRGQGLMGRVQGPIMVALGHGVPGAYGLGPNLPGPCFSACCCLLCGCQTPAGGCAARLKADFNYSIRPKKGVGIHS